MNSGIDDGLASTYRAHRQNLNIWSLGRAGTLPPWRPNLIRGAVATGLDGRMRDNLVFYVNGTRHVVRGSEAALTLTEYLRNGCENEAQRLVGTKVACAEGDCGACTVLVGKPLNEGDGFEYQTIDACIAFVYQMDRRHVITVEGICREDALSEVQTAMVDFHGSQCGFCTPGFVMALHGLVEEHSCNGNDRISDDVLRLGLSGNLCRCTGYDQILDAGRSFDLTAVAAVARQFDTASMLADFTKIGDRPVQLNSRPTAGINRTADSTSTNGAVGKALPPEIFLPSTLDDLLARRAQRPAATLVAGATDLGVQRNHGRIALDDVIFTLGVEELGQIEIEGNELIIGATVSWSRIESFVYEHVPEYHQMITRFGSPQVRHAGTLAGNLANASPVADAIPFHYVAGSTIELASIRGTRQVPIEEFYLGYKQLDLQPDEIIVSVRTPLPTANERLKLYKISKRRDMDISTVSAAFWLELEDQKIRTARIATGGVGPTVIRLRQAEAMLKGQPMTAETMRAAGRKGRDEITPISDVRGGVSYRHQLVENLFVKCFHDLSPSPSPVEV